MKKGQADNKLSKKFKNYHSAIDVDAVWGELELKRHPNKRKRFFLPFFFLFGIGVMSLCYVFFYPSKTVLPVVSADQSTSPSESFVPKTKRAEKENIPANKNKTSTALSAPKNELNQSIAITNAPNNQLYGLSSKSVSTIGVSTILNNNNPDRTTINNPQVQTNRTVDTSTTQQRISPLLITNTKESKTDVTILTRNNYLSVLHEINLPSTLASVDANHSHINLLNPRGNEIKVIPLKKRKTINIGFATSFGKTTQRLSTSDQSQKDLVNLRKNAEQALDAFFFDLFIEKTISSNLFLRSGIGFSQWTNKFEDSYTENFTQIEDNQIIEIIRDPSGVTTNVLGAGEVEIKETFYTNSYNRKRFLHIPLQLGLKFPINQKLHFDIATGPSYAFLINQSGQTIKDTDGQNKYLPLSELAYTKEGIWQFRTNLNLNYAILFNTTLQFGFQHQNDLGNLFTSEAQMKEQYRFLGLQLGLKQRF